MRSCLSIIKEYNSCTCRDIDVTALYKKSVSFILSFTDLEVVSQFSLSSGVEQEGDGKCVALVEPYDVENSALHLL